MWTGAYVVPDEITVAQAQAAAATFGRPLFVWDNTPVNDFPATEGRLILAPYARREAGLSAQVTGIVLNPMNQAAASKVQLVGRRRLRLERRRLRPGPGPSGRGRTPGRRRPRTVDALLAFFDLENLAPTSARTGRLSQPQAPALDAAAGRLPGGVGGGRPPGGARRPAPLRRADAGAPGARSEPTPTRRSWPTAGHGSTPPPCGGRRWSPASTAVAAGLAGDAAGAAAARAPVADLVSRAAADPHHPRRDEARGPGAGGRRRARQLHRGDRVPALGDR